MHASSATPTRPWLAEPTDPNQDPDNQTGTKTDGTRKEELPDEPPQKD